MKITLTPCSLETKKKAESSLDFCFYPMLILTSLNMVKVKFCLLLLPVLVNNFWLFFASSVCHCLLLLVVVHRAPGSQQ